MKTRNARFALVAFVATAAVSILMAAPSAATAHDYDVEMTEGTITVDDVSFITPDGGIEECPGNTSINGVINSTTHTVTGNIDIVSPFVNPLDSNDYVLEASGTADTHGTFDTDEHTFVGLHFTTIDFVIAEFDTETCETGDVVCEGHATLTASGGLIDTTLPLATGDELYVNATGSITVTFSECPSFLWFFLLNGADIHIEPHPTGGPGAIFEQT